ncbi:hypothetical protein BpHYR1_034384 [Brachionus plicatilis]|uniref:Nuclear transport factor 2 domain-containing protein n=1 Tax=Brachionus plicatilis TaxID=10195 RepID=A0A3M7SW11_BRAPC|nr:hypothetical protein BpHYR1_034384 [Brachionus plicatilis]
MSVSYFTCFDNNREDLIGAYNPNCLFSFTYNLHNPAYHRPFSKKCHFKKQNEILTKNYQPFLYNYKTIIAFYLIDLKFRIANSFS